MIMDGKKFASLCDVGAFSALTTKSEVDYAIEVAKKYHPFALFTPKCYCKYVSDALKGTGVGLEFSICSPLGHDEVETKVFGTKRYIELGLTEVETYLNLSYFKSGMYKEAFEDVLAVRKAMPDDMVLKCIIQTPVLSDEELKMAAQLCVDAGVNYVKTGNATYGPTTVHAVDVLANALQGKAQIKATTPFSSIEHIYSLLDAGATRLGITTEEFVKFYDIVEADFKAGRQK